jgi:hypothetical protein
MGLQIFVAFQLFRFEITKNVKDTFHDFSVEQIQNASFFSNFVFYDELATRNQPKCFTNI